MTAQSDVEIRQLFDRDTSTYTYLVIDRATRTAAIIDPVREQVERDLKLVQELGVELEYALDTHVHADHITSAGTIRDRVEGCETVTAASGPACASKHAGDGERLPLGQSEIVVLATPGHTDGCLSFLAGGAVFTGDALLIRGTGRTDFQAGDPATLYDSITGVLFELPAETIVYPGHDYRGATSSTIGEEREHNPRLAHKTKAEFVEIMATLNLDLPKKIAEAVPANQLCGKDPARVPQG